MGYTCKNKRKNGINIVQVGIGVFTLILVCFIINMMIIVSGIQGTARVVNYAGLVRGKTQRIVKLEISGQSEDEMLDEVESFISGLRNGDKKLNLVRLNDDKFQNKMKELQDYFVLLRKEITSVRANGYQNTEIISKSEKFFGICDEATGLAEVYSQKKATLLSKLEFYITADIVVLMLLIGYEFVKAVRYAAMNRTLQHKVYIDAATGIPNKNKCEELLNSPESADDDVCICSFDLNNLRRINNSLGHEAGDEYIHRFAVCLREAVPKEQFVGRDGGDEFIVITHGFDKKAVDECLLAVKERMKEESEQNYDMPMSYAVGTALACDYQGSTMRELFNLADKNMYINKNHVKREEAAAEKHLDFLLLKLLNKHGKNFSDCIYCNAKSDTYRIIRAGSDFFLAYEGNYSCAVEQIVTEQVEGEEKGHIHRQLQLSEITGKMQSEQDVFELKYDTYRNKSYSRLTLIPVDWDKDGMIHHFLLAFETIRQSLEDKSDAKEQVRLYYEQLKQAILENDSYVDAMLGMADVVYTVNLTKDILENNIKVNEKAGRKNKLFMDYPLPCSYCDYCCEYMEKITKETIGNYCLTGDSEKLLKRFNAGEKQLSVEFCVREDDGSIGWVQKTVLMTRTVVYDSDNLCEMPVVNAIVLLQDTTQMHERNEQEHERLQAAFNEMRTANRTKAEFLNRMSHDIRTPLNGILGLLKIDEQHFDDKELVIENHRKMKVAADHLLSLINDVLQMSKLEEGKLAITEEYIDLGELTRDIVTIIINRAVEAGIKWDCEKDKMRFPYPYIYGSPLYLRQIFLNIYGNCIKYNRPGGKINTIVEELGEKDGICTYRWIISDTGRGMSRDFVKQMFEPFAQERTDARSNYQGTGLGMTIVKGLVEQMNGTIEVSSEEGVGSTFVLTIPFRIASPEENVDDEETSRYSVDGLSLLLAEDNALNAEIAEVLLTDSGAKVTIVEDGKQALDLFEEKPKGTFDAILMDIMMPVMDGLEATRNIMALKRPDAKEIPIIAMTANAFKEDRKKCLAAGMNEHLAKPLQMDMVIETVAKCCSE